jgi:hypothetical protein
MKFGNLMCAAKLTRRGTNRGRDNLEEEWSVINSSLNDKHCPFHTKSRWTVKQIDRQKCSTFLHNQL